MFSNALIGFLFAAGFGAWIFAKIQKQTGGNTQSSLVVAGSAAAVAFVALVIILGSITK